MVSLQGTAGRLRKPAGRVKRSLQRRLPASNPPGYDVKITRPRRWCLVCGGEKIRSHRSFGREPYAPTEEERPVPLTPQRSHAKWRTRPAAETFE